VRAIRLGLPRSEAVQALVWLLSLVSNAEATAGAVDGDGINLYEAFALAAILGTVADLYILSSAPAARLTPVRGRGHSARRACVRAGDRRLMELVSMQLVDHINAHNVVLCGALAVEYGHPGLLEHCYYWLAAHLVSTARLVPGFFGVPSDANLIPGIEGNEFVHKFFHLHQAVFHDISSTLTERRIPFITYVSCLPLFSWRTSANQTRTLWLQSAARSVSSQADAESSDVPTGARADARPGAPVHVHRTGHQERQGGGAVRRRTRRVRHQPNPQRRPAKLGLPGRYQVRAASALWRRCLTGLSMRRLSYLSVHCGSQV